MRSVFQIAGSSPNKPCTYCSDEPAPERDVSRLIGTAARSTDSRTAIFAVLPGSVDLDKPLDLVCGVTRIAVHRTHDVRAARDFCKRMTNHNAVIRIKHPLADGCHGYRHHVTVKPNRALRRRAPAESR